MLNTLTLFDPVLDAKRKLPTFPTVMRLVLKKQHPPPPVPPVAYGDPGTGVSVPFEAKEKPETVLGPLMSSLV